MSWQQSTLLSNLLFSCLTSCLLTQSTVNDDVPSMWCPLSVHVHEDSSICLKTSTTTSWCLLNIVLSFLFIDIEFAKDWFVFIYNTNIQPVTCWLQAANVREECWPITFDDAYPNMGVFDLAGVTFIYWGRMRSCWESWRTWTHGSGEETGL